MTKDSSSGKVLRVIGYVILEGFCDSSLSDRVLKHED